MRTGCRHSANGRAPAELLRPGRLGCGGFAVEPCGLDRLEELPARPAHGADGLHAVLDVEDGPAEQAAVRGGAGGGGGGLGRCGGMSGRGGIGGCGDVRSGMLGIRHIGCCFRCVVVGHELEQLGRSLDGEVRAQRMGCELFEQGVGRCRSAGACSRPRAAGPRSPGASRGRRLGLEERLGRSAKRAGPGLRKLGERRPLLLLVVDVSAYRADVSHGPSNLWPRAGAPAIGRAVAYRYSLLSA